MEKYFKVGMPVWCAVYGKGIVSSDIIPGVYPIEVEFKNGCIGNYTIDGKYFNDTNANIVLSTTLIPPIINEPIDDRIELPEDVTQFLTTTYYSSDELKIYKELIKKYKL